MRTFARFHALFAVGLAASAFAGAAIVPLPSRAADEEVTLALHFRNTDLKGIVEAISVTSGQAFIFDERIQGRITIEVSDRVSVAEALEILNVALAMKGFATLPGPTGFTKIVPISEAGGSIRYIGPRLPRPSGEALAVTLLRLTSADPVTMANLVQSFLLEPGFAIAYPATNSLIVATSEAGLSRLIDIVGELDRAEGRELAVLRLHNRDAATLAELTEQAFRDREIAVRSVEIWANEFANSLIVRGSPEQIDEVRAFVGRLDRLDPEIDDVYVYRLRHADAVELAGTLSAILGGDQQPPAGVPAGQLDDLDEMVRVTPDPATNSLLISADPFAYDALLDIIEQLDVARPQVLIEVVVLEFDLGVGRELGFNGLVELRKDDSTLSFASLTDAATREDTGLVDASRRDPLLINFLLDADTDSGTMVQGVLRAAARNGRVDVLSSPLLLTLDNEQSEIRVGDNIPIPTGTTDTTQPNLGLVLQTAVERRDVGVTLRVTPQISRGDTLRLEIFNEISRVSAGATTLTGGSDRVGVSLEQRVVENVVVVSDGATVAIGGLISDQYDDSVEKVPFFGDLPIVGVGFRSEDTRHSQRATLLLLTPHIVRSPEDLELHSIGARQAFDSSSRIDASDAQRPPSRSPTAWSATPRPAAERPSGMVPQPAETAP